MPVVCSLYIRDIKHILARTMPPAHPARAAAVPSPVPAGAKPCAGGGGCGTGSVREQRASPSDEFRALKARTEELRGAMVAVRGAIQLVKKNIKNTERAPKRGAHDEAIRTLQEKVPVHERALILHDFRQCLQRRLRSQSSGARPPSPAPRAEDAANGEPAVELPAGPQTPAGPWATKLVNQFGQEWRLHRWIQEQNATGGQAPCNPHIWAARRALAAGAAGVSDGLRAAPLALDRRGKQWVQRFVRRWRLRRMRPRPGAGLSMEELRAKDRRRPPAVAESRKIAPRVPVPGPDTGPGKRAPTVRTHNTVGRISGPDSGSVFWPVFFKKRGFFPRLWRRCSWTASSPQPAPPGAPCSVSTWTSRPSACGRVCVPERLPDRGNLAEP